MCFYEENFDKAIETYKNVLDFYPKSDRLSSVYYNLGLCYKAKKDFYEANSYFQKVQKRYETSFEADKVTYLPTAFETTYYIIQFGAFSSLGNARKLGKKLSKKGYDCYIQKITKDGDILYRVRGGKFSNKYYAMRLLKKLKKDRFSAKIIIE